jgi:hypothetical protein
LCIDENILALEKRVEKEKETNEEQEKEEDDDSLVKLRITEYDSLQELMTDLSTRVEIKDASKNSWVHIGDDKCVLHVLSKGYLILERSHEGKCSMRSFSFFNTTPKKEFGRAISSMNTTTFMQSPIRSHYNPIT